MNKYKNYLIFLFYGLAVFVGLLLFFTFISPLTIYDADDWLYIYELRKPIPRIHVWNPTRVFPEAFMPLVSYFGALVINPLINDYFRSLSLAHGLFASIVITLYFVEFPLMFYKRKIATAPSSIAYGLLFLLLHFISHIMKGYDNYFLLGATNVTCFYFYVLAVMINASLVMHFISYGGPKAWFKNSSIIHKLIVAIWAYFAIFSNLFSSVVLATYIGTELLLTLIKEIKSKEFNLKRYCYSNWLNLLLIMLWFSANLIETTGGRARDFHSNIFINIPLAFVFTLGSLVAINLFTLIFEIIVFYKWKKINKQLPDITIYFLVGMGLQLLYIILLCASSEVTYAFGTQVTIAHFFYIFTALIVCLNQLIAHDKRYKKLPLILCGTILLLLFRPGRILYPYNYSYLSYEQCDALMNDIISQFKTAEANGETEIILTLPKFDVEGNWPLSTSLVGDRMSNALKRHKIIDTYITVKDIKLSDEKNKQFNISPER